MDNNYLMSKHTDLHMLLWQPKTSTFRTIQQVSALTNNAACGVKKRNPG